MKFIVGLGNPGLEYRNTKHNVGFSVVKALAKEYDIDLDQKLYSALLGRGHIMGEDVVLALPQTYMNLSGKTVGELFRQEIKSIEDLVVICDDINLKIGRIRLKKKGSAGGHKGLESIINILGTSDFARLRVGIATELHKGDITRYVLAPFKRKDHKHVSHAVSLAKDTMLCWLRYGIDMAMTRFNTRKVGTS